MPGNAAEADSKGLCSNRILVCGGRDFSNQQFMFSYLDRMHQHRPITCIIQGEARGADVMAKTWAILRNVPFEGYPANWDNGKSAGPRRNIYMLKHGKPDIVVAFVGGTGTAHMVRLAEQAGISTVRTWREQK